MTSWPVGLSTGCFWNRSILGCLETIRSNGFDMIEVCSSPAHLDYRNLAAAREAAARAEYLGMEVYSFHAPFNPGIDISSASDTRRESSVEEIFRAVEAAAILGVHYFVVHPGPEEAAIPAEKDRARRMENVVHSLARVTDKCRDFGMGCLLENKLPHLLFGSGREIRAILDALGNPLVGVCLDTGHASLANELHHLVESFAPIIRMVHIHDNNGHGDDHFPPGEGRINWRTFFDDIVGIRYGGALILELAGNADPDIVMSAARRGRTFTRRIARRIALAPHTKH